jgi:hypothetical protein
VFCSPSVPDQNREEIIMDDLIRREDAIKALIRMGGIKIDKALAMGEIRSIPSADRPQGEWIEHEHGFWTFVNDKGERDGWIPDYECNLCGSRAWKVKTDFCPNCGARMKGADDE